MPKKRVPLHSILSQPLSGEHCPSAQRGAEVDHEGGQPADEGEGRDVMVGSKRPAHTIVDQLEVLVLKELVFKRESNQLLEASSRSCYHWVFAWVNITDFFRRQMVNVRLSLLVTSTFRGDVCIAKG